jgi:Amt family ammonium transporter
VIIKPFFGYDDSLDAFGVHGIGGLWGALLTGVFATPVIQSAYKGMLYGNPDQLKIQAIVSFSTIAITFLGSLILLKLIDMVMGLRVTEKDEAIG